MTAMILVAAMIAGAGAGAGAGDEKDGKDKKDAKTCLTRRQINALSPLQENHALARLSAGRLYLLTLDQSCRGLNKSFSRNLVLERSQSRICDDGASLLTYEETGIGPTRCRILKIDRVASKSEALELIEGRAEEER